MREDLSDVIEFADNPDPRVACVLLLDTSSSMRDEPIDRLCEGVRLLKDSLCSDPVARRRVELALVTFNSTVTVGHDFVSPDEFVPPHLTTSGLTHMGEGIITALDLIEARKALYKQAGIKYYRPWVFLITDGEPQGEPDHVTSQAAYRVRDAEGGKKAVVFAIGVEGANMGRLGSLVVREPLRLQGLDFQTLFKWLSDSLGGVSRSNPGDQLALPPTGWATID